MRLHGDYDLDLSFQRGCGQNIESNAVICCLHLFSLGYKPHGRTNWVGSQGESGWSVGLFPKWNTPATADRGLVSADRAQVSNANMRNPATSLGPTAHPARQATTRKLSRDA